MNNEKILVADDEKAIIEGLKALLEEEGYQVDATLNGRDAYEKIKIGNYGLLLIDLTIPGMNGIEVLERIKAENVSTEVIIITGKGTITTAVDAMKGGAYDYLTKPVAPDRLRSIIPKALEHNRLVKSHRQLQEQIKHLTHFEDLVGQSPQMQEIYSLIDAVADSTANVIITGESGTGKELVSRAIHKKSGRRNGPFVAVNVSAFPKDILENELFGHEKGAFTGALNEKPGCFELAHKGTLFLDEIGEMAMETQAKILRALEERKFRRLGGKKEIEVDVRIVAATNRKLKQAIEQNLLREDLYYRLCVVEIDIPPLRDRISDIPLLVHEFLEMYNRQNNKQIEGLTQDSIEVIMRYRWPGNVRELKNVIERAVVLCNSNRIEVHHLPDRILDLKTGAKGISIPLLSPMKEAEKKIILSTLEALNNNKTKTANVLGISLKTLHNKLATYK
ncbi:response regulator [candidate division KSB1 bacterium]|nr:response regulator [candidate division KSB1 bacterium]